MAATEVTTDNVGAPDQQNTLDLYSGWSKKTFGQTYLFREKLRPLTTPTNSADPTSPTSFNPRIYKIDPTDIKQWIGNEQIIAAFKGTQSWYP